MTGHAEAILITGVYGVGKSTVTGQLADLLEAAGIRYAALDLDWLSWAWVEDAGDDPVDALMLEHLALLVDNLRRRGNDRFVLAGAVMTTAELAAIRDTLDMPVRVVRLTAPLETVHRRLANEPTTGRDEDRRRTDAWLASDDDAMPAADLVIANTGSIPATAEAVLAWTGWLEDDPTVDPEDDAAVGT